MLDRWYYLVPRGTREQKLLHKPELPETTRLMAAYATPSSSKQLDVLIHVSITLLYNWQTAETSKQPLGPRLTCAPGLLRSGFLNERIAGDGGTGASLITSSLPATTPKNKMKMQQRCAMCNCLHRARADCSE